MPEKLEIRPAIDSDCGLILSFIRELAEYERLSDQVLANEAMLRSSLFGEKPVAEALLGYFEGQPVCFAIFFTNFSTFLGKPGMYLEDLFVKPEARGNGFGKQMLCRLAKISCERGYGRLEWSVLDWNEPAIEFYTRLGAQPMNEWTVYRVTGLALENLGNQHL